MADRRTSASVLAEISVSSPRKKYLFLSSKKNYFLDQSIQKKVLLLYFEKSFTDRRAYIQFLDYLSSLGSKAAVLLMDPDMLVVAPVPMSTFAGDFDIGLVANREFAKASGSGRRMIQVSSASFLAEISSRSPRKFFVFII